MKTKDFIYIRSYLIRYREILENDRLVLSQKKESLKELADHFKMEEDELRNKLILEKDYDIRMITKLEEQLRDDIINADFHCADGKVFFDN